MMDLRQHLQDLTVSPAPPTEAQVGADLARGRSALRRRRTAQTLGGSAFGVAALVAAFTFASTGSGAGVPNRPATARPAITKVAQLVTYRGAQPKGFTIDKVPAGYFVQSDETHSLVLAPDRAQNPGPDVDPSADPVHDRSSLVEKIGIFYEARGQSGPEREGIGVQVGDRKGTLVKSLPGHGPDGPSPTSDDGDTGWELWVKQPNGLHLIVQFWAGLGLSRDQMVEVAAGVRVLKAVQQVG
jgi:hypothetical protein